MSIAADTIRFLVDRYLPYLTFAPNERFFPSDVNAWITNSIAEDWGVPGSYHSGTAVMSAPDADAFPANYPTGAVMGGSQFPSGGRLRPVDLQQLTTAAESKLRHDEDVFLNFGGWQPEAGGRGAPDFTQGSSERVYDHFSVLAKAMSAGNPDTPDLLQNPDPTNPMVPQGSAPVMFVEVDWAGRFTRLADRTSADFGPQNALRDLLDRLIVFTYYFFYPLTDTPPGQPTQPGPSVVQREGQWEAVSLFVRIDPDFTHVTPGPQTVDGIRIDVPDLADPGQQALPLLFLSYSFTGRSDDPTPGANVRLASSSDVDFPQRQTRAGDPGFGVGQIGPVGPDEPWRPAVYVTSGTHKNMFGPADTPTDIDLGPNSDLEGASGVFAIAGGGAGAVPGAGWAVGIVLAVIAVILLIASQVSHSHTTDFEPTGSDDDFVPPTGPTTVPGLGSTVESGGMPVAPDVRAFSMLPPAAGEEGDPLYRLPPWWDFPGRWGLRVEPSSAVRWDNGTHFRDLHGRSRAYWNTLALYRWMNLPENADSATSLLTP
jgi:hypothetical protein